MKKVVYSTSKFEIDIDKLGKALIRVYADAMEGRGIFYGGYEVWKRKLLPQWRIPKEFEFTPPREEVTNPEIAAKFLWTSIQFERQANSAYLERKFHQIWSSPENKWFFFADKVAEASIAQIDKILDEILHYRIRAIPDKTFAETFLSNAKRLVLDYDNDPRNLINNLTVEESRKHHMYFEGIGTGIANLNIIHFLDRKIATVKDSENTLFKVDIHKARIPLNLDCIIASKDTRGIHMNVLVPKLEEAYKKICQKYKFNPQILDAALWIIGSVGCSRADDHWCYRIDCPIIENCVVNTPLTPRNGTFQLVDSNGKRKDKNKHSGQRHLKIPWNPEHVSDLLDIIAEKKDEIALRPHKRWRKKTVSEKKENQIGLF